VTLRSIYKAQLCVCSRQKSCFSDARYGHAAAAATRGGGISRSKGKKVSQFHNFVNAAIK
jgi:hypothetical protein